MNPTYESQKRNQETKIEDLLLKQSKNQFLTTHEKNRIKQHEVNKRKQNKAKTKKKK